MVVPGTSRMWIEESDVGSCRDLVLREIGEYDRWRGRAGILDAEKLHADKSPSNLAACGGRPIGDNGNTAEEKSFCSVT